MCFKNLKKKKKGASSPLLRPRSELLPFSKENEVNIVEVTAVIVGRSHTRSLCRENILRFHTLWQAEHAPLKYFAL